MTRVEVKMDKKFATAINCMDGRVQAPVIDHLRNAYGVDYVDMITEPGPNKILADNIDEAAVRSIKRRVEISVFKHGSDIISIAGHYDCAGNPSGGDEQREHLRKSVECVKSWNLPVSIIEGLWVDKDLKVIKVA